MYLEASLAEFHIYQVTSHTYSNVAAQSSQHPHFHTRYCVHGSSVLSKRAAYSLWSPYFLDIIVSFAIQCVILFCLIEDFSELIQAIAKPAAAQDTLYTLTVKLRGPLPTWCHNQRERILFSIRVPGAAWIVPSARQALRTAPVIVNIKPAVARLAFIEGALDAPSTEHGGTVGRRTVISHSMIDTGTCAVGEIAHARPATVVGTQL